MGRHPDIDTRIVKFNRKLVKAKESYLRYLSTKDMDDLEECAEQLKIACDQAIKTAGVIAKLKGIQIIGSECKDRLTALYNAGIISEELHESMRGMCGFRNFARHGMDDLDPAKMGEMVNEHIHELVGFMSIAANLKFYTP